MTKVTFIGMSKREVVDVMPKKTRKNFPNVGIGIINSVDDLASEVAPRQHNIVFHKEGDHEGKIMRTVLGRLRELGDYYEHATHISFDYVPDKGYDHKTALYNQLNHFEKRT